MGEGRQHLFLRGKRLKFGPIVGARNLAPAMDVSKDILIKLLKYLTVKGGERVYAHL
jgi:hypothetical protein